MIGVVAARHGELVALCRRFGVRRLAVFGSAVTDQFDPSRSDVDFLVEMDPPEELGYFRAFFGFQEALEQLLGFPVDLISPSALENPYFAASVERTRRELFAA